MFTSKSDLYKPEWLELVFEDRNQEYGAYDLRKHYADNLLMAMGITFVVLSTLGLSYSLLHKTTPAPIIDKGPIEVVVPVNLRPRVEPSRPIHHQTPPPATHAPTIRFTTPVPTSEPTVANPPTQVQLSQAAIGTDNVQGTGPGDNILRPETTTGGTGTLAPAVSNEPVGTELLETMPEPFGGAAAWSKFLQKNMRYPPQASEAGIQGKVWMSFIIEKDGKLSNIVVAKGVGHGLDEEALRVLKLAPAWKPGIQNGQHVRVKYTIPISFVISEE
ncbi:MAG TPA: TonB family protein [Mucilaginibacter sp.]|nr:TonB family protein [Mucilaginibacter sp.]